MLISNDDALKRLNSPLNLINRFADKKISRNTAMSLFVPPSKPREEPNESIPEKLEHVIHPFVNPFAKVIEAVESKKEEILEPIKEEPKEALAELVTEADAQIRLGLAHNTALDLLTRSVQMLNTKLDDVKADKLPAVIAATSKVVESIRKERLERDKTGKDKEVHFHFYTPQQKRVSDYEVIDITP